MRSFFLFITLLFCHLCSLAQSEGAFSWPDKGVWPESPQAATIREVTSPLPSLLTGAAEFSVPLYSLEAEDFVLPFTFSYHSNGIRVNDDPCPWGYGWTLSPSIRISRRIVGRPDGLFTPANRDKAVLSHNECYHAMTDSVLDLSWAKPRKFPEFYTDPAPDIFTVQLPGKQFSVIFKESDSGYEAVTAACSEYRIETNEFLTWFRITDPRGYIYTFDVEGEYSQSPVYRTEWLPGSIELPSGHKILFSYIDCNSATHNMAKHLPKTYSFASCDPNSIPEGPLGLTHPFFSGGKHLSSVEYDDEKVSITYDGNRDGHRCIKSLVATIGGTEVSRSDFTYDSDRKMLQSVVTPEGKYAFEYDPHTFHEGSGRDWWGFSNGKGAGGTPSLGIDLSDIVGNTVRSIYNYGSDRNIDPDNMQARMLVKATYPTGGSARWEYEPHTFDPVEPFNAGCEFLTHYEKLTVGGGLRVRSISLYENDSDPSPQTTMFYYGKNRDGKAVCRAVPSPDTFVDVFPRIDLCQTYGGVDQWGHPIYSYHFFREVWNIVISQESSYMQYRFGEVPIWYECVETVNEEGKTITRFEDIIGGGENYSSATLFTNWSTDYYHVFSEGPQMTSRTVLRSGAPGTYSVVSRDTMVYDIVEGPFALCRGHHIKRLKHSPGDLFSSPDFSGTEKANCLGCASTIVPTTNTCEKPPVRVNGELSYYTGTEGIYKCEAFSVYPWREALVSRTTTEYRENGTHTTSQAMEYVPGTGLVKKVTDRVIPEGTATGRRGAASIVRTISYADAEAAGAEGAMAAANIIGIPLAQTVQDNTARTSVRALMTRYGNAATSRVFRPSRVYNLRGQNSADEYYAADFVWNTRGKLLSSADRAGCVISYTWDSHSRYPVAMTAGSLQSLAEWKPGMGVSAVTTPAGIRSVFDYDAAGRLIKSGLDGLGTIMTWEYVISHTGDNYVKETTWQNSAPQTGAPYVRSNYDGLGRLVSKVTAWNNTGWEYTSTAMEYDIMGRPYRQWVSSPVGSDCPSTEEVASSALDFYGDTKPYSITGYEASQRRLPVSTLKAGEAWHNGGGHRATVRHLVNDEAARSCACYILGSDMGLTYTGNYAKGVLSVEETTDEDGITEATYTDFRGRCVMKAHGPTRTYYVYNDYGDLCYILPPILSPRSYAAGDPDLAEYAYISRYDSRGRLIYSKKPGCGPEQFVYDNANRLVAETNADLGSKWRLHFYDSNGREVLVTEATLQPDAARRESLATPRSVARGSSPAAGLKGYTTDFDFPSDNRVRTAVYYDDYTLLPSRSAGTVPYLAAPAGLQTGLWAASDDNGPGVYRIFRYDSRGRKIHEVFETDRHRLSRSTAYTYTGKVAREVENVCEISSPTGKQWQLERRYGYDNAGCLTSETATFDSCTVLTRYIYDEAGRLSRTEKGPDRSGGNLSDQISLSSCTASRDYSYDVHGWPVKIVTKVRERIEPAHIDPPGISREYYNTASLGTGQILPGLFRTSTFTETIHYADGTNPRYNGTPSARGLTQGGRYDYSYDGLNRLSAAVYTAPESSPDADFSTEYTYDMLSRPLTIRRRGVVDIDGTTEIFGQLDDITLSYGGATLSRVQSNITDGTGREFYGRTGWANGTYMTGAVLKYNSAGRLIMDSSRMISLIAYNSIGLPVCYSRSPSTTDNAPRQERVYDATGRKLRQTDYQFIRGQVAPVADRRYVESFTFNTDTLERTDFSGGYFDGAGNAHFLFTDWQGNVTLAVSAGGSVEQHTGYYPYGEPWREPSGQHARLFAGKERVAGLPEGEYDFGPRGYRSTFLLWDSWDVKATDYPQWSPWLYCGANPINSIDPTGNKIIFINGKIGFGSPEAGSKYWNGRNSNFVKNAETFFNDTKVDFTDADYSLFSTAKGREKLGYEYAKNHYDSWISDMNPEETFNLVSHSMGGAFSKGIENYLKENGRKIDYNVMINTFQADEINNPESDETFYIDYKNIDDPVLLFFDNYFGLGSLENSDVKIREKSEESEMKYKHRSPIDSDSDFWEKIKNYIPSN